MLQLFSKSHLVTFSSLDSIVSMSSKSNFASEHNDALNALSIYMSSEPFLVKSIPRDSSFLCVVSITFILIFESPHYMDFQLLYHLIQTSHSLLKKAAWMLRHL